MSLTTNQIALHLDTVRATEAFVYARQDGGRYHLLGAVGATGPLQVILDDEPLAAAAVRDGLRRTASPDMRRVVAGYYARSAALVSLGDCLVIIGRRHGCLAGVSDEELLTAAQTVCAQASC